MGEIGSLSVAIEAPLLQDDEDPLLQDDEDLPLRRPSLNAAGPLIGDDTKYVLCCSFPHTATPDHSAVELCYVDQAVDAVLRECFEPGREADFLARHVSSRLLRASSAHFGVSVETNAEGMSAPLVDSRAQDLAGNGNCAELVVDHGSIWNMPCSKDIMSIDDRNFCGVNHPIGSGLPTRNHDLHSKIALEDIGAMRIFIVGVNSPHFLGVFENCIQQVDLSQVAQENTYRKFNGIPLEQNVPNTCAIVSSTICVLIHHRWKYETRYQGKKFPCIAASPLKLLTACRRKMIWSPKTGAYVGDVLHMIKRLGGVRLTNAPTPAPCLLPLHSWQRHEWDMEDGLTEDRIIELFDTRGPFVGTPWVCPWYYLFDAAKDRDLVYRSGCTRDETMQCWNQLCFGEGNVGLHSVVCFEYRVRSGELDVLVIDNHAPNGPERWIHFYELETIHTIRVKRMGSLHLGGRTITYPHSGQTLDTVVLTARSPAASAFQHPNVDAT